MPQYRAYLIGADGEFQNPVSLERADDALSLKKARQLAGAGHTELCSLPARQLRSITSRRACSRHD